MNPCCSNPDCPKNLFVAALQSFERSADELRKVSSDYESQITKDMPHVSVGLTMRINVPDCKTPVGKG